MKSQRGYISKLTHTSMRIPQQDPSIRKPDAVHIRPTWTQVKALTQQHIANCSCTRVTLQFLLPSVRPFRNTLRRAPPGV